MRAVNIKRAILLGFFATIVLASPIMCICGTVTTAPRPEITKGEFPFRIEYEINGETVVIDDTVICEFAGYSSPSCDDYNRYRKWKTSLVSGRKTSENIAIVIVENQQIYFYLGGPEYYMEARGNLNFHAFKLIKHSFWSYSTQWIYSEELLNMYKIKVISYEFSPPIENTFK